jgi:uncharacterized membrane protein YjjP (DUF1212 family)
VTIRRCVAAAIAAAVFALAPSPAVVGAATIDVTPSTEPSPGQLDGTAPVEVEASVPPGTDAPPSTEVPPGTSVPAESDTEDDTDGTVAEPRPSVQPQVRASDIDVGSIVLALLVLLAIGGISFVLMRRPRHDVWLPVDAVAPRTGPRMVRTETTTRPPGDHVDAAVLDLLIELGEALVDAGNAVNHVESTVRNIANVYGIDDVGVMVLPTALIVSIPGVANVQTEVSTAGRSTLRLDQVDDVVHLVNAVERGEVGADDGRAALARIRASEPPYEPWLVLSGYVLTTIGITLVLRGGWPEVVVAAVLGLVVGRFRQSTQRASPSAQPFWPLIAAAGVSTVVFTTARFVDDLIVFPPLVAPLITFLPGALLTTAFLELATGQIVAGAARIASGAMQLLLLALGIVAGAQLVGVPGGDIRPAVEGISAAALPWIGVALFGVGVVWFNGARRSTLPWIMVSLYAAFAGQVVGGLFFGSSLSAFFGAAAMTPVALLAARQSSGPTPLVTFLPGFWILVPGALGLEGVIRIVGADGGTAGATAITTTVISMVGISLGILLGLTLVASDPERPWVKAQS